MGVGSVWNIVEMQEYMVTDDDLNLCGKYKMVLNYTDDLMQYPNVIDPFADIT